MSPKSKDIINTMIKEAGAYTTMENIEQYIQSGMDLSGLPVQPLYLALRNLSPERASLYLTKLSPEQRKTFLNLDLWVKDQLDLPHFAFWVKAYAQSTDENIRREFVKSPEFSLFIKSRLNIWTFDVEDPLYPDHDYYFLTEDNLLLFEYDEEFELLDELKSLLRNLYDELGVEYAYAHIFKIVVDSISSLHEEEYSMKKEWLRDYGFVDYYDALELDNCFPNIPIMDNFIRNKNRVTGDIDSTSKSQTLHKSALIAFAGKTGSIDKELEKVQSQKRTDYLHFNFIRLVNGIMSLTNSLKDGPVAMGRIGKRTRQFLQLGFEYVIERLKNKGGFELKEDECLFDVFEFTDFYKIGNSLIKFRQKQLKKIIEEGPFDNSNDSFLGSHWTEFLDQSFDDTIQFTKGYDQPAIEILDTAYYKKWKSKGETFITIMPFISAFYATFKEMSDEGQILDQYYLNYTVAEIDFEAILISSFANFILGNYKENDNKKMGLTVSEFRTFCNGIVTKGKLITSGKLEDKLENFVKVFGFEKIHLFNVYFMELLKKHLEGYDFSELKQEDFKHVGGPILLSNI